MDTFNYENDYGKTTSITFEPEQMVIYETYIDDTVRRYTFQYGDINNYSVEETEDGFYRLEFFSIDKKIEKSENNITEFVNIISIKADKVDVKKSAQKYSYYFDSSESSIRGIIYKNSPLRSEKDKELEEKQKLEKLYEDTPESDFGTVYIHGPVKGLTNYHIQINGVTFFTMYTPAQEEKLKGYGIYEEPITKPFWADKKTLAFRIPYGDWKISYYYQRKTSKDIEPVQERTSSNQGPQDIEISISKDHKEACLKTKSCLFNCKLVEKSCNKFCKVNK